MGHLDALLIDSVGLRGTAEQCYRPLTQRAQSPLHHAETLLDARRIRQCAIIVAVDGRCDRVAHLRTGHSRLIRCG